MRTRKASAYGLLGTLVIALSLLTTAIHSTADAQATITLESTALAIAPQDAAFFATSVNLSEAWQDFVAGELVTRLRAVRYVQALEREWRNPTGPLGQVRGTLDNPNIRNLLVLLNDMSSREWFFYGGSDWCDMIEGLTNFQSRLMTSLQANPESMVDFFNELQPADIEQIRIPTTVVGFRLSDDDNARTQLDALEGILRIAGQMEELRPFVRKLKRTDLRDGQTLTWTFDNTLIPVAQLSGDDLRTAERIRELLEGRKFSISLGVKSNVFLVAIGEGSALIDSIGDAPATLVNHATMDVLKQNDVSELRSIGFASKRWRESQWTANFKGYFQNLSLQFAAALDSEAEDIPESAQWKTDILRDAKWLDARIAEAAPQFGDVLAWSQAAHGGIEGWTYDWNENKLLENAQPMHILQHAGRNSLILLAIDQQKMQTVRQMVDYVMQHAPEHLRRFIATAEQDDGDREKALTVLERAWPLADQAYQILRDKICPGMASNQTLLSFSATWTTNNIGSVPPEEPLPLPEFAVACKLDDRELFLEGCKELYYVFDRTVEVVRDLEPTLVPENYTIPRPREESLRGATAYSYDELSLGIPMRGFKPQMIVDDEVLVLGFSNRQVMDMLEAKPLVTRPGWMNDQMPVAAVTYFDFAGMISAVRPWIRYGFTVSGIPLDEPLLPDGPIDAPTGYDLLKIWDSLSAIGQAASTTTVEESGPTVTRWVWIGQ